MMKTKENYFIRTFCIVAVLGLTSLPMAKDNIEGIWLTGKRKAQIQITKKENTFFGSIVWMKEPNHPDGQPKLDKNNPIDSLRSRPILGIPLLRNFTKTDENTWENGKIYDPESGKDYSCIIKYNDEGNLEVRGFIGISLFGRTDTWSPVP